ncbi:MAG: DUF1207 domain-containing protein [Ignavibacteriales bacterium]|nr:MAG: hypothetical protein F9K26_03965 [Ignavibacteriaceae bacterium]MBV6445022.1 hypothetical protein [Ignavibacteriaceae bacterium]MBW7872592.1 DUF1207 domain-containing protein [Ignavibacteria bacterium]MCZ2141855.1 DUF1207 domain-containing protein [Ignavibacteriales bacterium]WKZ73875.1 MAG: DUF1207 domain-containing protein [Ignavibacteriaceae bacterium]
MRKLQFLFLFLIFTAGFVFPQQVELLPGTRLFNMLKAADTEPKFGLTFAPEDRSMKVDVGNAYDAVSIILDSGSVINAGAEFFAYAKVVEYREYRLQVAAIDGFFGGNISWLKRIEGTQHFQLLRLRFIHRSAHLVDGAWDEKTDYWKDREAPVPFADDFFEFNPALQLNYYAVGLKFYGGVTYSILIRPQDQKRMDFSLGSEVFVNDPLFRVLNNDVRFWAAYDLKFRGRPEYQPSHSFMAGIKFGEPYGNGLSIYASYYDGFDWFSSHYKNRLKKFGLGFFIDFNP